MSDTGKTPRALSDEQRARLRDRIARARRVDGAAIAPRNRDAGPARLSSAQEQIWFLSQLKFDDVAGYAITMSMPVTGPLDAETLRLSIETVVHRHEILRTVFVPGDEGVVQVVQDPVAFELPIDDLSALDRDEAVARATELRRRDAQRPFDLAAGLICQARLIRFSETEHELLLGLHHIVTDGWGVGILVREMVACYGALAAGAQPQLPALPVQYGDYAVWQREQLQGDGFAAQLAYWKDRLAGAPVLDLPADRARSAAPSYRGASERLELPPALASAVREFARENRVTPYITLLAAFNVLLYRHTGQQDVVVGMPAANRTRPELEPLVGCFVNTVVQRTQLEASMSFHDAVERVRDVSMAALERQDVPFEKVVEACGATRDAGRNPIFQIVFNMLDATGSAPSAGGVRFGELRGLGEAARFDLEAHVTDVGHTFVVDFLYRPDLFDAASMRRLLRHYLQLIEGSTTGPSRRIDEIAMASVDEIAAAVAQGKGPDGYAGDASLGALFLDAASRHSTRIAVQDGEERWTYAQLETRASRLAAMLRASGVGPNVAVGVCVERSAELIAALVGVSLAGGAYVPLEPATPADRAATMLAGAAVRIVVTTAALADTVPPGPWRVLRIEDLPEAGARVLPAGTADDLAYVMYTSGSTGRPKGVAVPQRAVARLVCGTNYVTLTHDTVMGQAATVAFDAATFELWGALLNGGRLVIVPASVAIAPPALGDYLRETGVTTLWLTSSLYNLVIDEAPSALAGVTQLLIGGEALSVPHVRRGLDALPETTIINGYGPTENTTFTCCYSIPRDTRGDAVSIPIGRPIAETTCYVVESGGDLAAPGVPGELYVGGAGLAQGYVGSPRLTAERFVPDAFSGVPGARLYRTGDLVRWTEPGVLEFLGRRDGQIKLRGYRIELGEVEAALRGVEGVSAAAAVTHGEGANRQLIGYVVPAAGAVLDGARVRAALRSRVPAYMVPAVVAVIDALPLNANGKVDRQALPEPGALDSSPPSIVAPRSVREAQIAAVWKEVLGRQVIGVDDPFFEVGGHSLLLMTLQAKLEASLGIKVSFVTLFQYPTIASLAAYLDGDVDVAAPAVVRDASVADDGIAVIGLAGRYPGAPSVEAFWDALCEGRELIRRFTRDELIAAGVPAEVIDDPRYVPARGALDDADLFDAGLFEYPPREAALLDPQHRLLLECAWTALEHAGYAPRSDRPERVGVWAGTSANTYIVHADRAALADAGGLPVLIASDKDFLATRVSYKLHLRGPAVTVQTACSTSLVAVHAACQALRAGECEIALAGGVSVTVPPVGGYLYQREGIASPDGHCRPFDASASGTVGGNGVGMVVLKLLRAALAAGDTVYAVIRGTAINNDGAAKVGFTAPSVAGQAAVVAAAQAAAGVAPETIGYVEGHGTGTALGDPIEVAALRQVFGEGAGPGTCVLGSVKGHVGHLDAAAGVTGLITTVLALRHGTIPPTLHFTAPSPQVALGPFRVPTRAEAWRRGATPRRAGVSSFGMGGTNAHAVLEEAPPLPAPTETRTWHVVPVSGQTAGAVAEAAAALAAALTPPDAPALADAAYTQQVGRAALPVRRVAVGQTAEEIAAALTTASDQVVAGAPPVVWVFPGQGTQLLRMAQVLDATEPVFRAELDACAAVVQAALGTDLRAVLYPTTETEAWAAVQLQTTTWTQVALVAVELALAAQWRAWGVRPAAVVGHSVGELAAACVAGVLTREGALRLAAARGTAMGAAPAGGMVAIPAAAATIAPRLGPDLWLAADNRATQCVVAGTDAALESLLATLANEGVRGQRLPAAGAFHSGLMATAVEPITAAAGAESRQAPQIAWVSTVTASVLTADAAQDAAYWGRQVVAPVRWREAVTAAAEYVGAPAVWLEIGPGHTLTHLVRGTAPAAATVAPLDPADADDGLARGVGALWAAGVVIEWAAYHAEARRQRIALPTYPFQRQRYWLQAAPASPAPERLVKKSNPDEWLYVTCWKQTPLRPHEVRAARCVLVLAPGGAGELLLQRMRERGASVTAVYYGDRFARADSGDYTIDGGSPADYTRVIGDLLGDGLPPLHCVHAVSIDTPSSASIDTALDEGFYSALALAQAMVPHAGRPDLRLVVLSDRMHAVTGDETVAPAAATLRGIATVLPQEHPAIRTRSIDVARHQWSDPDAVALVADEILAESVEPAVAFRANRRWVPAFELQPVARPERPPFVAGATYLITGGAGRIGQAIAAHLVEHFQARVILVSRRAQARRASAAGGPGGVLRVDADVSDAAGLQAALAAAERQLGPIRGVVHAAAATADADFSTIATLDRATCERHFAPKVRGTEVLDRIFRDRPLDVRLLMSSISSVLGGIGFAAYAAANAFMDAYAEGSRQANGQRWTSVMWDGWRFGDDEPAGEVARLALTPSEGLATLDRLAASCRGAIAVSTASLPLRLERTRTEAARHGESEGHAGPAFARPDLSTEYVPPGTAPEEAIASAWQKALGIDRIGIHDNFFSLGGHSLLAVHVMGTLSTTLGVQMSLRDLWDAPTVAGLASKVEALRVAQTATSARVADALDLVKTLSDDDLERLLAE